MLPQPSKDYETYLDDLIEYTNTWPKLNGLLNTVFSCLAMGNLTLNQAKSDFGQASFTYLGKGSCC